ncbi:transcriptional regulator [Crocosphaera sp. XPORK-15E]|uniref:transcriptional regulator n=1 Tax=Crocosphaera sp. XPORK-15E TaxID=3110247 RepID=UPI002B212A05|nr:transcriptional regulator [Crocosphaera sp. XPORK-15E]MEA5535497.1 transcriptional regulator [Crocosphaera sp. XPORK-15E]
MQNVTTATSKNYQDYLNIALNDPQRAAGNIQIVLEEKDRLTGLLKLTIEDIINARKNTNNLSKSAQLAYEKLAEILNQTDGQEIYAFIDLLETLGLQLTVTTSESD